MLIYYFGAMGSGKSAYALMTWHQRHRPAARAHPQTALIATTLDRELAGVTLRTGMSSPAVQLTPGSVRAEQFTGADTVIIDESQFLAPRDVDLLVELSNDGREVICFGLRTDFRGELFPGSRRLFERADSVRQLALEPRCARCERVAVINSRCVDGAITAEGPTIALDSIDSTQESAVNYVPMCVRCWEVALGRRPKPPPAGDP
jgi:thymidine kinase